MTLIIWDKFPLLSAHEHARRWLQFTANIGRAPNTIETYGRVVEDHLRFCQLVGADPLTVRADVVAAWIGDLRTRPNPRNSELCIWTQVQGWPTPPSSSGWSRPVRSRIPALRHKAGNTRSLR